MWHHGVGRRRTRHRDAPRHSPRLTCTEQELRSAPGEDGWAWRPPGGLGASPRRTRPAKSSDPYSRRGSSPASCATIDIRLLVGRREHPTRCVRTSVRTTSTVNPATDRNVNGGFWPRWITRLRRSATVQGMRRTPLPRALAGLLAGVSLVATLSACAAKPQDSNTENGSTPGPPPPPASRCRRCSPYRRRPADRARPARSARSSAARCQRRSCTATTSASRSSTTGRCSTATSCSRRGSTS